MVSSAAVFLRGEELGVVEGFSVSLGAFIFACDFFFEAGGLDLTPRARAFVIVVNWFSVCDALSLLERKKYENNKFRNKRNNNICYSYII